MRLVRPAAAATAGLVLGVAGLTAGPALAAGSATPLTGSAVSSLSLLDVSLAGHQLSTVNVAAVTSTAGGVLSKIAVVPATVDSTPYGAVTVTPQSGSRQVAATGASVAGVAALTSPALSLAATDAAAGPQAIAGASSLGGASVLGLPLTVSGSLQVISSTTTDAVAGKTLSVSNLALPSIGSLLAKLGLSVPALPVSTLNSLGATLGLASSALTAAQSAVSAASAAIANAPTTLAGATALVSSATSTVASATAAVASATSALQAQLNSIPTVTLLLNGLSSAPTVTSFQALSATVQSALEAVVPGITSALATLQAAQSALAAANTALAGAQQLLTAITNLGSTLSGLLGDVPLASIGSINVSTLADSGPHLAAHVDGTVSGVQVLGQDVLKAVTGSSVVN
ncbi:MAG: hypothetical protein ACYDB7_02200, partial [Mycobacteriales bacterium]